VGLATLLVIAVGFALPRTFTVTRSTTIAAEPERIHALVGDLERWTEWTTWLVEDPTAVVTIGDVSAGVGASQSWTGRSGSDELTITRSDPDWGVAYDIAFDGGRFPASCEMRYLPADGGTLVTWSMSGDNGMNLMNRYMGLMMDAVIGPMFEDGLDRLKVAAQRPAEPATE
jgi:hypothetical protein